MVAGVRVNSKNLLWLGALLLLTGLLRCWNMADVFVAGRTFFVDPDCYSRMTRVERILEKPGTVIHRHEFENWPEGTQPHTTAPFDDLTALLSLVLRPFSADPVNLAGAWISVLLGVATAAFLWIWMGRLELPYRIPAMVLFATSPILVHGTALGRPDHQSLLLLCMAVALGAECMLLARGGASRRWGIAAGAGWGLGLWVSLYEPAILLGVTMILVLLLNPRALTSPERWAGWAVFAAILLLAGVVDGWRSPIPDPVVIQYFPNWARTIGELERLSPWSPVFLRWTLGFLPLTPLLLALTALKGRAGNKVRCVWFWLGLLGAVFALTCWQVRWGYFLALIFVMSLPLQLAAFPKRWMALGLFVLGLWPVAGEWEDRLGWSEVGRVQLAQRVEQRRENLALFEVAQRIKEFAAAKGERIPILAPWWQSPALAYWSRQPCVAGSSHQSLPGTVDSARFYLSTDREEAAAILARRRVGCVVVYTPERVLENSATLLGIPGPPPEDALGALLYRRPHSPPPGLELFAVNPVFRVFLRPAGLEQGQSPGSSRNRVE